MHVRYKGYSRTVRPKDHLCRGFHCRENCDYYCIDKCPVGALSLGLNPVYETMGDPRWTPDMILSTWDQAENGTITNDTLETNLGKSGGGFDKLRLNFPKEPARKLKASQIDTRLKLNKRKGKQVVIDVPWYGGGMSYGSVSPATMVGKAHAGRVWNTFTCTGEGGYPPHLYPYDDQRDHAGGHRALRRARGVDPARQDRRVQVRAGRQAGPRRAPARRQEHPGRREDARGGRRRVALLAVPVPLRLLDRGPQEARRLDPAR